MKKTLLYISAALMAFVGLSSCDDNWETPPYMPEPPAGMTANTTINELKDMFWSTETNSATLIGQNADGEDIVIMGRVISSDSTGNIYKSFMIQDVTTHEALTIGVNAYDLYQTYQFGQLVMINCTGLYAGMYNNLFQLGGLGTYNGSPSMTFADEDEFAEHAWAVGLANWAAVDTLEVTIPELDEAAKTVEGRKQWQSTLVRIKNVRFDGGGSLPFSDSSSSTNRYLIDETGKQLLVRNSSYASFCTTIMPQGYGDATGILSYYGTYGWQFLIVNLDGLKGYDWTVKEPTKFTLTTTVPSVGTKFLIVAGDKIAQPVSGTYGWMYTADATINDDQIEADEDAAFTLEAATGGYYLKDGNDKYMFMEGTYNSFNVSTTIPAAGGVWSVEPQTDGTFRITNLAMSKWIQYSSSYSSYGAYSSQSGVNPNLYTIN
ncbi:MAG: DUF5689 domain-containing protein [Bacteroidales bacterium]|nr:DUF5689 domain-containing protein [Bacteroidales bacterium]MCD8393909.1 DUF5689 domain-containing protein [Bacteroidales bacterium]